MDGATTAVHSTTRGGDIHATRGTTGTGIYATTLGITIGIGDTLHMDTTITTIQDICLHAHRSIAQMFVHLFALTTADQTTALSSQAQAHQQDHHTATLMEAVARQVHATHHLHRTETMARRQSLHRQIVVARYRQV